MYSVISDEELDHIFSCKDEAILTIQDEYFIDASQAALGLIGISSLKVFQSLHPARISPEFQEDGQPSILKASEMMSLAKKNGSHTFEWTHIKLNGSPFQVRVTLRFRLEEGEFIDVHWRLL